MIELLKRIIEGRGYYTRLAIQPTADGQRIEMAIKDGLGVDVMSMPVTLEDLKAIRDQIDHYIQEAIAETN